MLLKFYYSEEAKWDEDSNYKAGNVYYIEFSYYWTYGEGSDFAEGTKRWYLKQRIDTAQ